MNGVEKQLIRDLRKAQAHAQKLADEIDIAIRGVKRGSIHRFRRGAYGAMASACGVLAKVHSANDRQIAAARLETVKNRMGDADETHE